MSGSWSHFPFFAGLSLFSAYQRINISLDAMVTGRAESLLFESGTSFLTPAFPTIQMPSSQHWALLALFSYSCLCLCGRRDQNPWSELVFSFLEPLVENDYPLKAPKIFHTPLSLRITSLGLPVPSGVLRESTHLPPASCRMVCF